MINRVERQSVEWEKMFAINNSDKGLIFWIYKWLQLSKQVNNAIKSGQRIDRHFSKGGIQKASGHIKRCSISLITGERQIKSMMRHHFVPIIEVIVEN